MLTKSEFHFALLLFAGMCIGQAVFADGYTEPRIEPEPGHSGKPLLLRCENDPSRTFRHEHQRRAECRDENRPREVECSMNHWTPGVLIARNKPEKECA